MCHNSVIENEQIEKCIENGMPRKIIKSLKNTMRKRIANEQIDKKPQITLKQNSYNNNEKETQIKPEVLQAFVSKCPFGHGKFSTPATQFSISPLTVTPINVTTPSLIDKKFDFSNNKNNNNNVYERFPQISQLNTTRTTTETETTATTADIGNTITNLNGHFDDDNKKLLLATNKIVYNDDILAKSTQLTREFTYTMQQAIRTLQSSRIYTLLTKTTQPAHLVAIGIITFVLLTVWPELIDTNNDSSGPESASRPQKTISSVPTQEIPIKRYETLAMIAYLGAFSIHFGAQIWMTFVSGLSLYFSLPRHIFGQCQQILFPKYFAMNAALSIIMLILYVKYFISIWSLAKCVQFGSLALTGTIELLVRLYLAPPLLRLMHEKYKIEGSIGSGKEIGSLVQGDLIKCPHYQRIHKAFRRIHMIVAIGNIITMAGSCLQLYNIAGQLQISIVH